MSNKVVKTYNNKQVSVNFGNINLSGFGNAEFLSVEMNEDQWELFMGVDGTGTRSKNNNLSAKMKISLAQSSDSNAIMQGFWNADQLSNSGVQPFIAKDLSGGSIYTAASAWIMKQPAAKFAKGVEIREWTLETDQMSPNEGGN